MQIDWLEILAQTLEIIVIPLIGGAVAYLASLLKAKAKDERVKKYIDMLDDTIMTCVLATNQTYVEALKRAGAFDEEAHKQAFQLTFDAVTALLTDEAQKYLAEIIKDLDGYIEAKIEAQVSQLRVQ